MKLKFLDPTDVSTLINKSTGKHIIANGFEVIPVYKGKKYSVKDVVNKDGTVNVRKAKQIMEEVAEYFGGKKMQNRAENPKYHKDDPNTWLHTKKVAKNAWNIPVPDGYTKQDQMIAALGHDFGKILSGDGHAEVSYNLIKQIFPDATEKQLNAIRRHMDPLEEIADQLELGTHFADIGVVPGADLGKLGLSQKELDVVNKTKWFKQGGNINYFGVGGFLKSLGKSPKITESVVSEDAKKLLVKNEINNLPEIQSKMQRAAQELNQSEEFIGISSKRVKHLNKNSNITIFPKPVTINQLKNDIYKRYAREFENLTGIKLSKEEVMNLSEATDRFQDVARLEEEMNRLGSKNYTVYGVVSSYSGSDFNGFILGTTKISKDNPAAKLMQEQIKKLRGSTISGEELNKLEDAVINSVPKNRTYLYSSDNPNSNVGGYFNPDTGLNFVNTRNNTPDSLKSAVIHEGLSHSTDSLVPDEIKKVYTDLVELLNLPANRRVVDSKNWQEMRATFNELKNKLAPDGKVSTLKKNIEKLDSDQLSWELSNISAYGQDYGDALMQSPKETADLLKKAIIVLPATALAVLFGMDNQFEEVPKAQEGIKLPKIDTELDYEEPIFVFRHLKNEFEAEDFDNDLTSYYYQGRLKNGQLDENAIQELQRVYNLDKTQLQETFDDLHNAGLGRTLTIDLENIKNSSLEKVGGYKEGGRLIPKAMSGKVLEEVVENILSFEKKELSSSITKEQLLLTKRLLGFVSGKGTQVMGTKLNRALDNNQLTKKQLEAIVLLGSKNKVIKEALKSKGALTTNQLATLANTQAGKSLINRFKEGKGVLKEDIENGINSKYFSENTKNNILNQHILFSQAADKSTSKALSAVYAGEKTIPSKELVQRLETSAKNTGDDRVQLLSTSLKEAYNEGIYLPKTYLDYVESILKTSKAKNGSDISEYSLQSLTKNSLKSNSLNDDIDQAVTSLQEIANGNFTVNQKILEKVFTTKGGSVIKNPLERAATKLERKHFTEKEWSRAMEEQMGDVSKIDDLTEKEINDFFDFGTIPNRFKTPYHSNIPKDLQKYYNHSNNNIYDMRVKKKYVEQVVEELKKKNPNLEGKVEITPITSNNPVKVLVTNADGKIEKKTLEGYNHLIGYNFTVDGKEILPELRTTLEQHHEVPLGIIQGESTINNPGIATAKELVNTRIKQITVNPEYLLLSKPFHTGTGGIHYNDKWTPQDISRQKELAFTHLFKNMDEVEEFYTKVSRKRYANLLSKGDKDKALQLEQEMIDNPSKLQEYRQEYLLTKRKEFVKKLDKDTRNKIEEWRKFRKDNNLTTEEFVEIAKEEPKYFPGFSKILKGFDSDEDLLAANILKRGGNIQQFK